ncbi:MAG: leucine-rich repeat protein [Roseburia sp.]|nr:leucine-rich repeat protein [Roseburia sp.]
MKRKRIWQVIVSFLMIIIIFTVSNIDGLAEEMLSENFEENSRIECSLNNVTYISNNRGQIIRGFNSYGIIAPNGDLYFWGQSLGEPNYDTPFKLLSDVNFFATESYLFAAITSNGDLYCWGENINGQVGNGTTKTQVTPVKVLSDVISISIDGDYCGAITSNGDLYCWGENDCGQIGNGTVENQLEPMKILSDVVFVSSENKCSSAITSNGDLYCWGCNGNGQVGNGTKENQLTPVKVLGNVKSASYSSAITLNNDLYCWGYNGKGQVGNGTRENQLTPTKILSNVISFANSFGPRAAITLDRELYCWGDNWQGQVGNGENHRIQTMPVKVLDDVISISMGYEYSSAITSNGDLYCWGSNVLGEIGNGTKREQLKPIKVLSNVVSAFMGYDYRPHSGAITSNGDLYCWGTNDDGQVGNGTTEIQLTPVKILSDVITVSVDDTCNCAITFNGDVYCWGDAVGGQVGNGTTEDQLTPIKIMNLGNLNSGNLNGETAGNISCPKEKQIAAQTKDKLSVELIASSEQEVTTLIKNLTVSSNDESICKVNLGDYFKDIETPSHAYFDIELTGVNPGETDIIISTGTDVTAKCHITVTSENLSGKTLATFQEKDLSANISIDWDLDSLIHIGDRNKSLALEGLLLSQDTYFGEDAVAERMISFGLLDKKDDICHYEDTSTNTGYCAFAGVRTIRIGNEDYNIITAVARGTQGGPEWLGNLMYAGGFFKYRGDDFCTLIKYALDKRKIDINDSHNRFFITGHSLGGTMSSYLGNKLMTEGVVASQIACYTYASPFNCTKPSDKRTNAHIYNYIGKKDLVPTVGQATNYVDAGWLDIKGALPGMQRYGNDIPMGYGDKFLNTYSELYGGQEWKYDYDDDNWRDGSTAGNITHLGSALLSGDGGVFHHLSTYLAQLLMDENYHAPIQEDVLTVAVFCPVDVYVNDANGNVAASVVDNTVVNEGDENVIIAVMEDAKFITLKKEGNYTVDFVGTDTGTMSYTVADKSSDEMYKVFTNVALEKNKRMKSMIGSKTEVPDVQLLVCDKEGAVVAEVMEDGQEIDKISHQHTWAKEKITRKPTCTRSGKKLLTCEVCGETKTETIPKASHTPITDKASDPTYVVPGKTEGTHCAVCGAILTPQQEIPVLGIKRYLSDNVRAKIKLSFTTADYTGKPICPEVKAAFDGATLTPDVDYQVSYKNNVNIGTGTVVVTGIGKYMGSDECNFTITIKKGKTYKAEKGLYKTLNEKEAAFCGITDTKMQKVKIPASVVIGGKKFRVTAIEDNALKGTNITSVSIGANVKTIGNKVFYGCKKLKKIIIPSKVKAIGEKAFYNCKNLKRITLNTTKLTQNTVGNKAFAKISKKAVVKVPKGKVKAYKKLLQSKGLSKKATVQKN